MAPIRATTWHEVCFLDDDDLLVGHGRRARVLSMLERVIYLLVLLCCGDQKELEENARKNVDFYRGLVVARLPVQIPPRVAETRQFHGEQKCIVLVITVCWFVDSVLIVCDDMWCGREEWVLQNGQQLQSRQI
jgi:hypothetical protein